MYWNNVLFFFLCLSVTAQAQNLVPNGNFEVYSSCPTGISQIINATGWSNAATATSPDYHNSCASSNSVKVPKNAFGYQQDCCAGAAYAGIYSYGSSGTPNEGREYISVKLNDTLATNKKYLASMYVSKSNNFDYAIATLGMYFTSTPVQAGAGVSFINVPNPQVKNTVLLDDTINWTLIQDTVVGTGNELYLTIGNFSYDSLSDTVKVGGSGVFFGSAYYYIDGVSVLDIAALGTEQLTNKGLQISLYPNPNNGIFTLNYDLREREVLEITDLNGKLVGQYNLSASTNSLSITNDKLENGVYLYHLSDGNTNHTGKIVIIK